MLRCESHLRWYLLIGAGSAGKSLQGALLERAECAWFMSDGRRAPQVNKNDWNYMAVNPTMTRQPFHFPDEEGIMRAFEVRSVLNRIPDVERNVLCALWGPIGESWAEVEGRRRDFAVYPLTEYGRKWLEELRSQGLTDDSDQLLDAQGDHTDDLKRLKFKRMQQESEILIAGANTAWIRAQELPSTSA